VRKITEQPPFCFCAWQAEKCQEGKKTTTDWCHGHGPLTDAQRSGGSSLFLVFRAKGRSCSFRCLLLPPFAGWEKRDNCMLENICPSSPLVGHAAQHKSIPPCPTFFTSWRGNLFIDWVSYAVALMGDCVLGRSSYSLSGNQSCGFYSGLVIWC
jgi:hypothetical protein